MIANERLRALTVIVLALLACGVIAFLLILIWPEREINPDTAGWATAAFLALREFISKIEKIVNGPAAPLPEDT